MGIQGRIPESGAETEALNESCLLDCFTVSLSAFLTPPSGHYLLYDALWAHPSHIPLTLSNTLHFFINQLVL